MNATGTEAKVCEDIAARQRLGVQKYGFTVADNPLPLRQWLQHAYEESLDLAVYLRRAMDDQSGWMPIETAPHDGIMWVLGYEDDTGETGIIIFDSNPEEEYADEHPDVWTDGYRVWHPSHWMPLPPPPNQ